MSTHHSRHGIGSCPAARWLVMAPIAIASVMAVAPPAPAHDDPPASVRRELAEIRGRLLEADGTPASGLTVTLLELRGEIAATFGEDAFDDVPTSAMRLVLATTATDADGRFQLGGAHVERLHVIGIDLGGPRATARVVDVGLERGVTSDLGELQLAPGVTFTGIVTDDAGAPIAGARLRVLPAVDVPIPPELVELFLRDERLDRVFIARSAHSSTFLEPPAWARELEHGLLFPTTTSAADGTFRLPLVPYGIVTLSADHPDYVGVVHDTLPTGREVARDVGRIELQRGRVVHGKVLAGGLPVSGAIIWAGSVVEFGAVGPAAIAHSVGATTEDGTFAIHGVAPDGALLVAVQRRAGSVPFLFGPLAGETITLADDTLTLELPPKTPLTLSVKDLQGRSLASATFRFMLMSEGTPMLRGFGLPHDFEPLIEPGEIGSYRIDELPPGDLLTIARAPGCAYESHAGPFPASGATIELALPPERLRCVHVIDAATHAPLEGVELRAGYASETGMGAALAFAISDDHGDAALHQLNAAPPLILRASHPGYVTTLVDDPLADDSPDDRDPPVTIALQRGGDVVGRITTAGPPRTTPSNSPLDVPTDAPSNSPPSASLTLLFRWNGPPGAFDDALPRATCTAADGAFRLRHLREGPWYCEVVFRLAHKTPAEIAEYLFDPPTPLGRGTCLIREGGTTTFNLTIDS